MKIKDVITQLQTLNQEAGLTIVVMQSNKAYGVPLQIEASTEPYAWVNGSYGGSITVWLPDRAYIARLPKT